MIGVTLKPQSKQTTQTTTALDQKSRFFLTTVLKILTNFGDLREIWRVISCTSLNYKRLLSEFFIYLLVF